MDIWAEAQRRAFSVWLRTGRLPRWLRSAPAEFKFNPWHDPDTGRFTFAGTGRYSGRAGGGRSADAGNARHSDERQRSGASGGGGHSGGGRGGTGGGGDRPGSERFGGFAGGGGGFAGGGAGGSRDATPSAAGSQPARRRGGGRSGGGGASGSWDAPANGASPQPRRSNSTAVQDSDRAERVEPGISPRIARRAAEENWQRIERNGYTYLIDTRGRTRHVSGPLAINRGQVRSRSAQSAAGGPDRRAGDHGGHYIARRFDGPTEAFNHFAQDASFNRSGYRALENEWARAFRAGKRVEVKIEPVFEGNSQRPSSINVWSWIDGRLDTHQFANEPAETARDKR